MSYVPLYTIEIEHHYFAKGRCRGVKLGVASGGLELFRRRGLLLRQRDVNIWDILYDKDGTGVCADRDILQLTMVIVDREFPLYTSWEGYDPNLLYSLDLPVNNREVKAEEVIRSVGARTRVGSAFCSVSIRLTDTIINSTEGYESKGVKLLFEAPRRLWEYIFIPHDKGRINEIKDSLRLEVEGAEGVTFSPFEDVQVYGRSALRTVSQQSIAVREHYDFRVNLIVKHQEQNRSRQILRQGIEHPELIKFQGNEIDSLRRVCYL